MLTTRQEEMDIDSDNQSDQTLKNSNPLGTRSESQFPGSLLPQIDASSKLEDVATPLASPVVSTMQIDTPASTPTHGSEATFTPMNLSLTPRLEETSGASDKDTINETWFSGLEGKEDSTDGYDEFAAECEKAKQALASSQGTYSAKDIFFQLQKQFFFAQHKNKEQEIENFFGISTSNNNDLRLVFVLKKNLELGIFEYTENEGSELNEILTCIFCKDGTALIKIRKEGKKKKWNHDIQRLKDIIEKGFNVSIDNQDSFEEDTLSEPEYSPQKNRHRLQREVTHLGSLKFFSRKKEPEAVATEQAVPLPQQLTLDALIPQQFPMEALQPDDAIGIQSNSSAKKETESKEPLPTEQKIPIKISIKQLKLLSQKGQAEQQMQQEVYAYQPTDNSVPTSQGKTSTHPLTTEQLETLKKENAHLRFPQRMQRIFFKHATKQRFTHEVKTNVLNQSERTQYKSLTYKTTLYTTHLEFINSIGEKIPLTIKIMPTKLFQPKYDGLKYNELKVKITPMKTSANGEVHLNILPNPLFKKNREGRMDPNSWKYHESDWKSKADIKLYYDFRVYHGNDEILFDFGAELTFPKTKEFTAEDEQKLKAQIAIDLQTKSLKELITECETELAKELKDMGESMGELNSLHANKAITGKDAMKLYCSSFHDIFNRQSTGLVDDAKFTDEKDSYRIPLRLIYAIIDGKTYYENLLTGVSLENGTLNTAYEGVIDQDSARRAVAISTVQNYRLESWFDALLEQKNDNPLLPNNNEFPDLLANIAKQYFADQVDLSKANPFSGTQLTVKELLSTVYTKSQELMKETGNREPTTAFINLSKLLCDGIAVDKNIVTKPCDKNKKIFQLRNNVYELLWRSWFWELKNPTMNKKPDLKRKAKEEKGQDQSNKRMRLS